MEQFYSAKSHSVQNDKSAKTEKPWTCPLKMFPSMYMEQIGGERYSEYNENIPNIVISFFRDMEKAKEIVTL